MPGHTLVANLLRLAHWVQELEHRLACLEAGSLPATEEEQPSETASTTTGGRSAAEPCQHHWQGPWPVEFSLCSLCGEKQYVAASTSPPTPPSSRSDQPDIPTFCVERGCECVEPWLTISTKTEKRRVLCLNHNPFVLWGYVLIPAPAAAPTTSTSQKRASESSAE